MSTIAKAFRSSLGLFFDDGTLAVVILALLMATGFARHAEWIDESVAMSILLTGTIGALLENVLRVARRKSRASSGPMARTSQGLPP
jgi:hypothetical protein